jgi:hypothetical protein
MGIEWQKRSENLQRDNRPTRHPIWGGIGCLIIVVLGIMGYFLSGLLIETITANEWIQIPEEVLSSSVGQFFLEGVFLQILMTIIIMIGGYTIISVFYAFLFPPQLGEKDAPPMYRRRRQRK